MYLEIGGSYLNIAYFSPFNPIKSGISDFSEELVYALRTHIDIDIFVDGYRPSNKLITENFKIYDIRDIYDEKIRKRYDLLVYHVGNNAAAHSNIVKVLNDFPGICELHDISLHHFMAEDTLAKNNTDRYLEIMKYCHGHKGEKRAMDFLNSQASAPWEKESLTYTVNKHIIDKSKAVIVHSDMAKQMIRGVNSNIPVINIPHHSNDIIEDHDTYRMQCRKKLNLDNNMLIFASFGFASKNKRILQIIEALRLFKKKVRDDFLYIIVGKVQDADIINKIKESGLNKNIVVTGFIELDEFKFYMGACDIALNLRYPTQGESSGSLHRLLGMGKPVMVTDIGSFQEYPDDVVIKISYGDNEINEIYKALYKLYNDTNMRKERQRKALLFAKKNCDINLNAVKYVQFFEQILNNTFQFDEIDSLIDTLFEIGLTDEIYIDDLAKKVSEVIQNN